MNKIALLDLMNLAHRAYWSYKDMKSPEGKPSGVVHGARIFMTDVFNKINPTHFIVITDAPGDTFRHEIFPDYKGTRKDKEEDFKVQLTDLYKMFTLMGIHVIECPGYEADDVIGSAVEAFKDKGEVLILSGDKDFIQLLTHPNVSLGWTDKEFIKSEGVPAKLGIQAEQMVDYLSLTGDSSDNVPGVKGVGPKRASALLSQFGSLENIYTNLAAIKSNSVLNNLAKSKDNAYLSKSLVEIQKNIQLGLTLEQIRVNKACLSAPNVLALYSSLGLRTGIL
jgi:DNA polymerase-1